MLLPAIHTLMLQPRRHLRSCELFARRRQWSSRPVLRVLQRWQVTCRWLLARYALSGGAASPKHHTNGEGIVRRLCAEVCVELEVEDRLMQAQLADTTEAKTRTEQQAQRAWLRHLVDRVMETPPSHALFSARVFTLGKAFDLHLQQTIAHVDAGVDETRGRLLGTSIARWRARRLEAMMAPAGS